MDWSNWFPAITSSAVLLILAYLARDLIKSSLAKGIQYKFDKEIEELRTILRQNEETFRSDLRAKELEIVALREGALGGLANRQALLDKRRLEAVERVWSAVVDLMAAKGVAATMSMVKFEVSAKEAARNSQFREIFKIFGKSYDLENPPENVAKYEQPFVTPMAWALLSAFQAVILYAVVQAKVLEIGVEEAPEFFNDDGVKAVLKAALPHQSEYIDRYGTAGFYNLLDEIEKNLIAELRNMLEGADIDEASIEQSANIMKAVKKVSAEGAVRNGDIDFRNSENGAPD